MSALYRLQNLDYSYEWNKQKVPVLKTLNISFDEACFCCIVGPSGSGKTTLLNLLGLLDSPTNGQIIFGDKDVGNLPEIEKEKIRLHQVGFVFQSFYLIPTLTILENTSYFLPSLGYSQGEAKKTALETLDLLGIANHAHKKPLELSGGQRQRAAIARAIAKKPAVVLADEPTANLDSETSEKIIGAFKELQKSQRTSFIFSTHDSHLVKYAETIHHIKDGQISTGA